MKNYRFPGKNIEVTAPVALSSGEPFVVGNLPLVATGDALISTATVGARACVVKVKVKAHNGTINSAVAAGDKVYCDNAVAVADGRLNKNTSKTFFGTALGAVTSGQTTEIDVLVGNP